jgi:hypothetical protein
MEFDRMESQTKSVSLALVVALTIGVVSGCSRSESPKPSSTKTEASLVASAGTAPQQAPGRAQGADCLACENTPRTCSDFVSCDSVSGEAAEGSPAAGKSKASLCKEVLDCVRDSGCAVGAAPIACYCGNTNAAECLGGGANGKCRAQLERGMETAKAATVIQRFKNTKFGGGLAMARIDCDQTFCLSQCGLRGH